MDSQIYHGRPANDLKNLKFRGRRRIVRFHIGWFGSLQGSMLWFLKIPPKQWLKTQLFLHKMIITLFLKKLNNCIVENYSKSPKIVILITLSPVYIVLCKYMTIFILIYFVCRKKKKKHIHITYAPTIFFSFYLMLHFSKRWDLGTIFISR